MTTVHSIKRAKERIGLNKKQSAHLMTNAFLRGKDKSYYQSNYRKYNWLLTREISPEYKAVIYNDICFIIANETTIVTLYPIPKWFNNPPRYSGKERIRNQAKYQKYNYFDKQ